MKATAAPIPEAAISEPGMVSILTELFKARLTGMVLITTMVGFYSGSSRPVDFLLMLHAVAGTALVACGAAALNQLLERDLDARMERTSQRPLPAGHLHPDMALLVGAALAAAGLGYLAYAVNYLTAALGAVTLVSYLFIYTPLKRITTLNTAVGAIPGALPPLMGWTAATGTISAEGWALFAILFFWQLPHFMAIAWIYKEDYARAGFKMLPVVDPDGRRTGSQAVSHALGLLPASLAPVVFGVAGYYYAVAALVLGGMFLYFAIQFSRHLSVQRARHLFWASIAYLPVLLGVLVVDKIVR